MKVNGEAVYATKASPLKPLSWGRCTRKEEKGKTILYLSVFEWPKDGKLVVPGLTNKVTAKFLSGGKTLKTKVDDGGLMISLPEKAPDPIATVIKLNVKGNIESVVVSGEKKTAMEAGELH